MDTRRLVCKSPTQARNNGQSGKIEYGRPRRNRECRWLTVAVYELTWKVKERHLIITGRGYLVSDITARRATRDTKSKMYSAHCYVLISLSPVVYTRYL